MAGPEVTAVLVWLEVKVPRHLRMEVCLSEENGILRMEKMWVIYVGLGLVLWIQQKKSTRSSALHQLGKVKDKCTSVSEAGKAVHAGYV